MPTLKLFHIVINFYVSSTCIPVKHRRQGWEKPKEEDCVGEGHGGLYKSPLIEESDRLRGEGYQVKFIDPRFERWQVVGFRKGRRLDVP